MRSSSRRSPDGAHLQLKSGAKSGSRRSPDGAYQRSKSGMKSGSRRNPDGVFLRSKSRAKSGSRRSPDGVLLRRGHWEGPPFSHLVLNDQTLIGVGVRFFPYFCRNRFQLWLGRGSLPIPNAAVGAHMGAAGPFPPSSLGVIGPSTLLG